MEGNQLICDCYLYLNAFEAVKRRLPLPLRPFSCVMGAGTPEDLNDCRGYNDLISDNCMIFKRLYIILTKLIVEVKSVVK